MRITVLALHRQRDVMQDAEQICAAAVVVVVDTGLVD